MNLIFDFDGTIADTLDFYLEEANKILLLLKRPPFTKEKVRQKGLKNLLKEFNISPFKAMILLFYARWRVRKQINKTKIFEGLKPTLAILSKKNDLFILTSNSTKNVERLLTHHNMSEYFSDIYSSPFYFAKDKKINNLIKKNNLNKKHTYYIGDEVRDIKASKKAGIKAISVTWGFESRSILSGARPYKIINKPNSLLTLFK